MFTGKREKQERILPEQWINLYAPYKNSKKHVLSRHKRVIILRLDGSPREGHEIKVNLFFCTFCTARMNYKENMFVMKFKVTQIFSINMLLLLLLLLLSSSSLLLF